MVAPMGIVMLVVMRSMFENKRLNAILLVPWQFLNSMIAHHSRAILVCEESSITDPEIVQLCEEIVKTQREEIAQMEVILERR